MGRIRVAVIGAGAAGLCALRHLTSCPDLFEAVCFELNSRVGGTWVYTDQTGTDNYGLPIQSSMYKNLRTNLPKEAMAFPDYPFPENLPSYIMHQDVLEYLESYVEHFNMGSYIKFETMVQQVTPVLSSDEKVTWDVSYSTISNQSEIVSESFDAVMICSGHYSVPYVPEVTGFDRFKGQILHSHSYRDPIDFEDKTIALLGARASGQDIAVDLSNSARKIYLCHKEKPLETHLPDNVEQKPGFAEIKENSVICENGEELQLDAIMFCTGYIYKLPFLSKACNLQINDERLTPLYKHMVHIEYPTMCFIGIVKFVCPFPTFDVQVRFFLSILNGTYELPNQEEMLYDTQNDFEERVREGIPIKHVHSMGSKQCKYNDQLADLSKTDRIPKAVFNIFNYVLATRVKDLTQYKKYLFEITGPDSFRIKEASEPLKCVEEKSILK